MSAITLYLVETEAGGRSRLAHDLSFHGHDVCAFETGRALVETLTARSLGCVVADTPLPDMCHRRLLDELSRRGLHLPVLFLAAPTDLLLAVEAIKAGADDVVPRTIDAAQLWVRVAALLGLARQRHALDEQLREALRALTAREREVMVRVVDGLPNKTIAEQLGISFRTVEVHRKHVMQKTHAVGLLELVRMVEAARRAHLLSADEAALRADP